MSAGGVVGFAVLAAVLLTACSLAAALLFRLACPHLVGPVAEKNAAAWALLAPIVVATSLLALTAWSGSGSADHCVGHDHHAHFCLVHGAAWLHRPWAIAIAVGSSVAIALRLAFVAWRRFAAMRAIAQVRRVSRNVEGIRIAPSDRVFCFVAGWRRPEVFVSSRAWDALSDDEREAVLHHERAHAGDGDLWMAAIVDVAASLAAPLTGTWLRERWADAGERSCDLRAAEATNAETVAGALVRMCRAGSMLPIASGFAPTADVLEHRIRAVLDGGPAGRRLGWLAWSMLGAALIASTIFATYLHHALETLLG
jgi:Zn-dependent protease with chaperone function